MLKDESRSSSEHRESTTAEPFYFDSSLAVNHGAET